MIQELSIDAPKIPEVPRTIAIRDLGEEEPADEYCFILPGGTNLFVSHQNEYGSDDEKDSIHSDDKEIDELDDEEAVEGQELSLDQVLRDVVSFLSFHCILPCSMSIRQVAV